MKNNYAILGITQKATEEEIRLAYLNKLKKYHPDLYRGNKEKAQRLTAEINVAYLALKNEFYSAEKNKDNLSNSVLTKSQDIINKINELSKKNELNKVKENQKIKSVVKTFENPKHFQKQKQKQKKGNEQKLYTTLIGIIFIVVAVLITIILIF